MAVAYTIRRAGHSDAAAIADAQLDSIRTLGGQTYSPDVVNDWSAGLTAATYIAAMERGEIFHIAVGGADSPRVLGFSSYRSEAGDHRTAVYVRGDASRQGVGTTLFRQAEAAARSAGAATLNVAASLVAVDFYKRQGFEEISRGHHRLRSGQSMACVFMRKNLSRSG